MIIFNVKRYLSVKSTLDEQANFAYFYFDYIVNNLMVPGHIETWLVVLDFNGVGIT